MYQISSYGNYYSEPFMFGSNLKQNNFEYTHNVILIKNMINSNIITCSFKLGKCNPALINDKFNFQKNDNPVENLLILEKKLFEIDSNIEINHEYFNGYLNQIVLYLDLNTNNLSVIEDKIKNILIVINNNVFNSNDYTIGLFYDLGGYSFSKIAKSNKFINF